MVTDCGWSIVPTTTVSECPPADVLFVPGGEGSFALAAAGLLSGERATSHWVALEMVAGFGVVPVAEHVQLVLEYDLAPPLERGSPRTADPRAVRLGRERARSGRLARVQQAAGRLAREAGVEALVW